MACATVKMMAFDSDYNNHYLILTNIFPNYIYINLCECPPM